MEIEFNYYEDFFHVAVDTYKEIVKLEKELNKLQANTSKLDKSSDDFTNKVAEKNDRIGRLASIVIIFCATSLEAYINYYAISRLSKNYLKTYLDKLDLFSKWIVIPRISTGTQLNAGSRSLQELSWLITLRNKLVHSKSRKIQIDDMKETDFLWGDDAMRAIETVKNLAQELKKIDDAVDIEWTTHKYKRYPFFD
jgi:hypothetical protein